MRYNKDNKNKLISKSILFLMLIITNFCLVIKVTSQVKEEWVARYNGPGNNYDQAYAIAVDSSGNVYVTGRSYHSGTSDDYATIKYNSIGIEQWVARYNGPGDSDDQANAIAVDSSGNVYVTGYSDSVGTYPYHNFDYATIKYNSSGVEQWVARYNGTAGSLDWANAIAIDSSGNVYVTGHSAGPGTTADYTTIKYNSSGVKKWVARYNGPGNYRDEANAMAVDSSGNVYVTGWSDGDGTFCDCATIKYNSAGVEQWVARYNDPGNSADLANAIAVDSSGNVYVTGYIYVSATDTDYVTIKYNTEGIQQWVVLYNSLGNDHDCANAIAVDSSGNVYVTGYSNGLGTSTDYATIKYNTEGIQQWVARYNGTGNDDDDAETIAVDNSGNVYVTGSSWDSGAGCDYATIKYSQNILVNVIEDNWMNY